jgi:hypothetical protein
LCRIETNTWIYIGASGLVHLVGAHWGKRDAKWPLPNSWQSNFGTLAHPEQHCGTVEPRGAPRGDTRAPAWVNLKARMEPRLAALFVKEGTFLDTGGEHGDLRRTRYLPRLKHVLSLWEPIGVKSDATWGPPKQLESHFGTSAHPERHRGRVEPQGAPCGDPTAPA